MADSSLVSAFLARSAAMPDATVLRGPGGRSLTHAQLWSAVARFRHALAEIGVQPGDRVMAQTEKSPEALFLYLAALAAGAIYIPLNTGYTPAELRHFLSDATPVLFVVDPARRGDLQALAAECGAARVETLDHDGAGSLAELAGGSAAQPEVLPRGRDDLATILYTSGTTGRPKGAMLSHGNLLANAQALCQAWEIAEADVLLHALPIFHAHGLFVAVNTSLLAGAQMIFLPRFDPAVVRRELANATTMMGVPTFYTRLLAEPDFGRAECAHMRLFVSGSAPLLESTFEEFRARTGHTILERYGMTETSMNCSNPLRGPRRAGSVGPPLPGVEVRVADEAGRILGPGETGGLQVRGPNVFQGYWNLPEKSAEEFRDGGWFVTGDMARIDADGYVWLVGRSKDLIISGGYNVYPKEVEERIDALPGVVESAVIGVPHPDFGEAVVAVVVPDPARPPAPEAELIAALRHDLAAYKLPKRIHLADSLPRNTMGKVQKNLLRESYADA